MTKSGEFTFSKPIDERAAAERVARVIGEENFQRRRRSHILIVGGGHIGSKVGVALARQGYNFTVVDADIVRPENLILQEFEPQDALNETNKVIALARRAALLSPFSIVARGVPMWFHQAVRAGLIPNCDAVIAAPDSDLARLEVASYFYGKVPIIFAGISKDSNYAYIFVQEPGKACLRCAFPNMEPTPAVGGCQGHMAEMGYIVTGYALFALDSLVMDHPLRKRSWNLCKIYLDRLPDLRVKVEKRPGCELCSSQLPKAHTENTEGGA